MPPELIKILREAYARSMKDPELLADAAKRGWEVDAHTGGDLEAAAKDVINQPKEVIERMKWVLGNERLE
jgi:tripartite-type tricarboxylate transporter receptor subunit TctC